MTVLKQSLNLGPLIALLSLLIAMVVGVFYLVPNQYDYLITITLAVMLTLFVSVAFMGTLVVSLILPEDVEQ